MEARTCFLVIFMLFSANSSICECYVCTSPAYLECTCQNGYLDNLIIVCDGLPEPKKEDIITIRISHIFVKNEKIGKTVRYNMNILPRLNVIEDQERSLICNNGICTTENEQTTTTTTSQLNKTTLDMKDLQENSLTTIDLLLSTETVPTRNMEILTDSISPHFTREISTDSISTHPTSSSKQKENNLSTMILTTKDQDHVTMEITSMKPWSLSAETIDCKDNILTIIALAMSILFNICFTMIMLIICFFKRRSRPEYHHPNTTETAISMQESTV